MFNETHNRLSSSFFDHLLSYTASKLWTRENFLRMRAITNFEPIHWNLYMRRMHEWMERRFVKIIRWVEFYGVILYVVVVLNLEKSFKAHVIFCREERLLHRFHWDIVIGKIGFYEKITKITKLRTVFMYLMR